MANNVSHNVNGNSNGSGRGEAGDMHAPEVQSKRDDYYFFDNVVFKVEDTLFQVPKHGFNVKDTVIGDMFLVPSPLNDSGLVEGSAENFPIVLHGIKAADFRGFLRALYPFSQAPLTYEEWVSALHLSTMWFFKELRARSIANLTSLIAENDVCSNILLAKRYGVQTWLRDSYTGLSTQAGALDLEVLLAKGLDPLTLARIYSVRDTLKATEALAFGKIADHYCSDCNMRTCVASGPWAGHSCGIRGEFDGVKSDEKDGGEKQKKVVLQKIEDVFSSEFATMEYDIDSTQPTQSTF